MSNVPMPEPVGFIKPFSLSVIKGLSDQGRLYTDIQRCADDEFTAPLITTTQAQAYADARVREALEDVVALIKTETTRHLLAYSAVTEMESAIGCIRSIMLPTNPPA